MNSKYDYIVVGAGFAGAVVAREMAEQGKTVLVIEQRNHIGGNCYDERDSHGVLIHAYGPHIFHTSNQQVYEYLSQYTNWYPYHHEVAGCIDNQYLPIPFNLNSLAMVYDEEKAQMLENMLIETYGMGAKVPILKLREHPQRELRELAEYVYQNVFLYYTMKQWGKKPDEIDPSVSARVPVVVSHENGYFQDTYQGMPSDGFTVLFQNLLKHDRIELRLGVCAQSLLAMEGSEILFEGKPYAGEVVYTGAIDEFFSCKYGRLPYRTLHFEWEHYKQIPYQPYAVVNYTVSEDFTRISEFRLMTGQQDGEGTTILKEYSRAYTGEDGQIPYYAINNDENQALYERYREETDACPRFHLLGRLAEYQYYNIDAIVERAYHFAHQH